MFKKKEVKETVNKENLKVGKKKFFTKKRIFFFILLIISIFVLYIIFYFYQKKFISTNNQISKIKEKEQIETLDFSSEKKKKKKKNENLNSKIKDLEYKIDILENKLVDLKINPQKTEIIRISLNIKDKIEKNINFNDDLQILTSLSKNRKDIYENVIKLKANENFNISNQTIKNEFEKELNLFLKENNFIKNKFLSNYITIRKIKNVEKNSNEEKIINLENFINTQNYIEAYEFLNSNEEYKKYFKNSYSNLETKINLNNSINNIINYVLNND